MQDKHRNRSEMSYDGWTFDIIIKRRLTSLGKWTTAHGRVVFAER